MSPFVKDAAERVVRSFCGGLLAVLTANLLSITSLDAAKAVGISALYGGVAAVLALATKQLGPRDDTASML
jgi:Putative lactococcus lactis phage r1t holin